MKLFKNKKIIAIGIVLLLLICSFPYFAQVNILTNNTKAQQRFLPKLSNSNINITTPENKTYLRPMSGCYPAVHGFENDTEGTYPVGWTINGETALGGTAQVLDDLDGHYKVVELFDNDSTTGYNVQVVRTLEYGAAYGDVELWVRSNDTSQGTVIELRRQSFGLAFLFKILGHKWVDDSNTPLLNINGTEMTPPSKNKWYHVRIAFETTTGSYESLGQWQWKIWVNNEESTANSFINTYSPLDRFLVKTTGVDSNYYIYFDAVGYSWHPNYNIGDNRYEGLLLNFETDLVLDWVGYSLDGQENKTISGDTVIVLPEDGSHNIQVFGNDSIGDMYESDIRYFTILIYPYQINISTPENIFYTGPMTGYYTAPIGFENDQTGTWPVGWLIDGNLALTGTAQVLDSLDGHNKVVELFDDFGAPGYNIQATKTFDSSATYGDIEFWIRFSDVSKNIQINIMNSTSGEAFDIRIMGGDWTDTSNTPLINSTGGNMAPPSSNTWYHIRIAFETTMGGYESLGQWEWKVWIDDKESDAYSFINNYSPIDQLMIQTVGNDLNYYIYFDAVGYSWHPNYIVGDSKYEGLLLNFETSFILDWVGYSLDAQENKTILGDAAILLPNDGLHNIQVFSNDVWGKEVKSDIRLFSVDTTAPISGITFTPHEGVNKVNKSTTFDLSANDGIGSGVASIMYRINNSGWILYTGSFDLSSYDYGYYLISYYAVDNVGNAEDVNTILVELVEISSKPSEPVIPGFNILLILLILSISAIILIEKKYRIYK